MYFPNTSSNSFFEIVQKGGSLDLDTLLSSWKKQRELDDEYEEENINLYRTQMANKRLAEKDTQSRKVKRSRANDTSAKMFVIDRDTGEPRLGTPSDSLWWINHVLHPELMTKRMHHKNVADSGCHLKPGSNWWI